MTPEDQEPFIKIYFHTVAPRRDLSLAEKMLFSDLYTASKTKINSKKGHVYRKIDDTAKAWGIPRRTVERIYKSLETKGFLRRKQRHKHVGYEYRVTKLTALPADLEEKSDTTKCRIRPRQNVVSGHDKMSYPATTKCRSNRRSEIEDQKKKITQSVSVTKSDDIKKQEKEIPDSERRGILSRTSEVTRVKKDNAMSYKSKVDSRDPNAEVETDNRYNSLDFVDTPPKVSRSPRLFRGEKPSGSEFLKTPSQRWELNMWRDLGQDEWDHYDVLGYWACRFFEVTGKEDPDLHTAIPITSRGSPLSIMAAMFRNYLPLLDGDVARMIEAIETVLVKAKALGWETDSARYWFKAGNQTLVPRLLAGERKGMNNRVDPMALDDVSGEQRDDPSGWVSLRPRSRV